MSKYLGSLFVVLFGVACGGTTDTEGDSAGGTSQGSSAGQHAGGAAGTGSGGAHQGGGSSGGSHSGGVNTGGFLTGGSASGGAGTYDPRCPAHEPMGACSSADTALTCQYALDGCLCYQQPPGTFIYCQQVDPTCTYVAPSTGGAGGAGGVGDSGGPAGGSAGTAGTSSAGAGGFSAKIAAAPRLVCSCSGTMWQCTQGF